MDRKNNYRFTVGPADDAGGLHVSGTELRGSTVRINDLFPMDYVGLDAGWTGDLTVRAVDRKALERLRRAHETWGATGYYPDGFTDHLDALERALSTLPGGVTLTVVVAIEPPESCQVRAVSSHQDN
jgi:hypothetical protein